MKHLKDTVIQGHEVIYYQDGNEFTVDIREDDTDGDIIAGYAEFATEDDARRVAMAYLDGLHQTKIEHCHFIKLENSLNVDKE